MGQVDKSVVRSPEKAGVGGSTPSLATKIIQNQLLTSPLLIHHVESIF
jgi:hypothetical protein